LQTLKNQEGSNPLVPGPKRVKVINSQALKNQEGPNPLISNPQKKVKIAKLTNIRKT
jgi:hypothetical protein